MKVKALDNHLINVIAAGEVIDRPASLVKELVENSLDAGAGRIEVEAQQGGLKLLRVSDDGEGMASDDLALAIERHTTSKISSEADLEALQTLGFRGEALASICEVARVTLISKAQGAGEGCRLVVEGGKVQPPVAAGRARGTTVEVRDLFYNLPARRKFLKSDKTEALHITRLMKRFLFSHPHVRFQLIQGGKCVLDSPGSRDLLEVAGHLYGPKTAQGLVPVSFQGEALGVEGWVSTAQLSRGDRNEQYTYVNRRAVSDPVLHHALNRAYEGALERQRYPYVCLHLTLDPRRVDVNVHPQKHEVRFLDAQAVRREVLQALSQALVSRHAAPQLPWKAMEGALRHRSQRPPAQSPPIDLKAELERRRQWAPSQRPSAPLASEPAPRPPTPAQAPKPSLADTREDRVVGQLHGTYILVQTPEGFELIDQHVAHERVLYERFLAQLAQGGVRAQQLLLPETLKVTPDQAQALAQHGAALARLGIEVEAFGSDTFLLRGWPQALAEHHAKVGFRQPLERLLALLEGEGNPGFEALAGVLVASLACEAAVVKNTPMPLEAMRHLVHALRQAQDPYHCPHGRPIVLQYGLGELERAFKRR